MEDLSEMVFLLEDTQANNSLNLLFQIKKKKKKTGKESKEGTVGGTGLKRRLNSPTGSTRNPPNCRWSEILHLP